MAELEFTKNFLVIYIIFTIFMSVFYLGETTIQPIEYDHFENGFTLGSVINFIYDLLIFIVSLFVYEIIGGYGFITWILFAFRLIAGLEIVIYIASVIGDINPFG